MSVLDYVIHFIADVFSHLVQWHAWDRPWILLALLVLVVAIIGLLAWWVSTASFSMVG